MTDEDETCDGCGELLDDCTCDEWCGTCEKPLDECYCDDGDQE